MQPQQNQRNERVLRPSKAMSPPRDRAPTAHSDVLHLLEAWRVTQGEQSVTIAIVQEQDGPLPLDLEAIRRDPLTIPDALDAEILSRLEQTLNVPAVREVRKIAPGCSVLPLAIPTTLTEDVLVELLQTLARNADVLYCDWPTKAAAFVASAPVQEVLAQATLHGSPRGKGCLFCFPPVRRHEPDFQEARDSGQIRGTVQRYLRTDRKGAGLMGIANATPLIAGVAALVLSANPALSASEAIQILTCGPGSPDAGAVVMEAVLRRS